MQGAWVRLLVWELRPQLRTWHVAPPKKRNEKNNLRKNEEIWDYKMHDDGVNIGLYLQEFTGLKLGTEAREQFLDLKACWAYYR